MILNKLLGFIFGKMRSGYYNERYKYFRRQYNIISDFGFNGTDIRIYGDGKIIVGSNSYIGTNSTIELYKGQKVVIGNNCAISHNVRMYTSTARADQDFNGPRNNTNKVGDIIIGNGVWIGANAFINPGIKIGDNAVIGANSVVTRDVPENAIVRWVLAKLIRYKNI